MEDGAEINRGVDVEFSQRLSWKILVMRPVMQRAYVRGQHPPRWIRRRSDFEDNLDQWEDASRRCLPKRYLQTSGHDTSNSELCPSADRHPKGAYIRAILRQLAEASRVPEAHRTCDQDPCLPDAEDARIGFSEIWRRAWLSIVLLDRRPRAATKRSPSTLK